MDIRRFEIIPILDRIQVGDKGTFQVSFVEGLLDCHLSYTLTSLIPS